MYRVVLYGLTLLAACAFILSAFKLIFFTPLELAASLVTLLVTCGLVNWVFAKLFKIPANVESVFITAWILFLVLAPSTARADILWIAAAGAIAMASKYVLVFRKHHIFNPAAIGVLIPGLLGSGLAIWWVATPLMFPLVLVVGFLVVRKVHHFNSVIAFLAVSLGYLMLTGIMADRSVWPLFKELMLSWPIIFFASVMFTEPLTMPARKHLQIVYGALIGFLFSIQFHVGPVYSSPELALVLGNIFSFIVSPKQRLILKFKEKTQLAANMFEFIFTAPQRLQFLPGQYSEWTLFHEKPDTRGNRRYFTIASAPESNDIAIGIRLSDPSSSFKQQLANLKTGDAIMASSAAGDFVLPKNKEKKIVFIAGGIGVTPFASMLRHLLETKEKRTATMLYSVRTCADIAYQSVFDQAEKELGIKTHYIVTDVSCLPPGWTTPTGYISDPTIRQLVPDFKERLFYISGPFVMVDATEKLLKKMGVPSSQIKTDFFPGFAG